MARSKYKLASLGDEAVGKTSILTRFVYDIFHESHTVTLGLDFVSKTVFLDDRVVRLQLWSANTRQWDGEGRLGVGMVEAGILAVG